jgi:transcriptional regulator with XRE-family HTH domain
MSSVKESEAFAQRLRVALESCGVRLSPSVVANEFNLRYWGRSITPHTARNWLMGNSLPTQDKLRVLAEWLQVSPDELRFGNQVAKSKDSASLAMDGLLNLADREMLSRYLALSVAERKTVRDVVEALTLAAGVKNSQ